MSALPGLRVVRSGIHGYGVVTTRPFAKGEVVCHGDGVVYQEGEDFDDTYALVLDVDDLGGPGVGPKDLVGDHIFYDLVDQSRWLNHACEPNSEVESDWDATTGIVTPRWMAVRDIAIGEEITYDYAFSAEVAEPCACGTAGCRGLIIDDDPAEWALLSPELRQHLRK